MAIQLCYPPTLKHGELGNPSGNPRTEWRFPVCRLQPRRREGWTTGKHQRQSIVGDGNIEKPPALKAKGVIRISMVPLYDFIKYIYIYMIFYILMSFG